MDFATLVGEMLVDVSLAEASVAKKNELRSLQ